MTKTPFVSGRVPGAVPHQPYLGPERPGWMTDSRRRCSMANADWEMWTSESQTDLNVAAGRCRTECPFVRECLTWAAENGENCFVWGGINLSTEQGRKKIRAAGARRRPKPARAASKPVSQRPRAADRLGRIRALWEQNRSDAEIALQVGLHPSTVAYTRKNVLGLPSKFGPGGQRRKVVAA